jgi:hypothetical protein
MSIISNLYEGQHRKASFAAAPQGIGIGALTAVIMLLAHVTPGWTVIVAASAGVAVFELVRCVIMSRTPRTGTGDSPA